MPFRFESLKIGHMARAYSKTVGKLTAKFSRKEDYALTSHMLRTAHSIALNIAEGSAKKSPKHFDLFRDNASGSKFKVVSGSFQALEQNYIAETDLNLLYTEGKALAKAITAFRRTPNRE
ncbi:MAG: four helix bundle protein [Anaerolineales bacterium]|nr:four helix bundle protein [Anaerolineales bacterium]